MASFTHARQQIHTANATQPAHKLVFWHALAGILISIVCTVAFVKIFLWVEDSGKGATSFDRVIQLWVHQYQVTHPVQAVGLLKVATFLALMGSPRVIVSLAALATLLGLVWRKVRGAAWTFPIAIIGSGVIIQSVKLLIHRDRPSSFTPLLHESGYSFPSGHSLIAMVVYGLLGYFVLHLFQNRTARLIVRIVTVAIVLLIGVSRVYVGVHYPTDVLAGWIAGIPWLLACLALHEVLARRWPSTGEPVLSHEPGDSSAKTLLTG